MLNDNCFSWGKMKGSGGRPSNRTSRAEGITTCEISLTHWISGFIAKGKIDNGNYSRKEMIKLEEEVRNLVRTEMYLKLIRAYNVSGISAVPKIKSNKYKISFGKETKENCLKNCKCRNIDAEIINKYYR